MDQPISKVLDQMQDVVQKGGAAWVKWTCPGCHERCVADEANVINTGGYTHTEKADGTPCGTVYTGDRFGLRVVITVNNETIERNN